MKRLIFVCSGNICRSPMAEGIAKKQLSEASVSAQVISMGTLGLFGRSASENAVLVCAEHGIDIARHRSQGVSLGILGHADLVVVMEAAHRDFILQRRGELTNVSLFSSFDGGPTDVVDPVGQSRERYEACFARLDSGIAKLVPFLAG